MARSRKLKNIRVEEVSLVDHPANLRPFMFVKSADGTPDPTDIEKQFKALDLAVKSDGTTAGTTITLNGRDIADVRGFMLSLSPMGEDVSIFAEYTVANKGKTGDGFDGFTTYRLSKADGDPEVVKKAKVTPTDIENIEAYLEDLPANLRQSVQNIISAVRPPAEATTKEQTMPNEDGKVVETPAKETPVVAAPVIDVAQIAASVVAQLTQQGMTAEAITSAVLGKIEADRKTREDAATAEAKAHADKVSAGEELAFASEDEMIAHLAADANQEALADAES